MTSRMTPNQGSWLFRFTGLKYWEPEDVPAPSKQQAERGLGYAFAWSIAMRRADKGNKAEIEKNFNQFVEWTKQWFPSWTGESMHIPLYYPKKSTGTPEKEEKKEDGKEGNPQYRLKTLEEMVKDYGANWHEDMPYPRWNVQGLMDNLLGTEISQDQYEDAQKEGVFVHGKWKIGKDCIVSKQGESKEEKPEEQPKEEPKKEQKKATPYKPENDPVYGKLKALLSSDIPYLNIFLVGPAGCGKTTFPNMIGKELNKPVTILPCSAGTSPQEIRGDVFPERKDSPVSLAVSLPGIIVFDEYTMMDASTAAVANSLLANNILPASTGLKARDPGCVIIVTANTMGHGADRQYVGNNQLDAATLDRFKCFKIAVDYNEDYEHSIGDSEVVKIVHELRAKIKENGIRKVMSTRAIINASALKKNGFSWWKESLFDDFTEIEKEQLGAI